VEQNGIDAVNFRSLRESKSLDLDSQFRAATGPSKLRRKNAPLDEDTANLFSEFNSLTREMVGED
jgi:protein-serine/threonine kinase